VQDLTRLKLQLKCFTPPTAEESWHLATDWTEGPGSRDWVCKSRLHNRAVLFTGMVDTIMALPYFTAWHVHVYSHQIHVLLFCLFILVYFPCVFVYVPVCQFQLSHDQFHWMCV